MPSAGSIFNHGIVQYVPIDKIDESKFQVRISYGDIDALAQDIKENGLLQHILLRTKGDRYEVVHGHRRLRAVKVLGLKNIMSVVREMGDRQALLIHGSENIQRRNLSPIEEARLYRKEREFGMSLKEISTANRKDEQTIQYHLYLLDLPDDIQAKVHNGELSYTKARELARLTREPIDITTVISKGRGKIQGPEPAPRTIKYYDAIRTMAEDSDIDSTKRGIKIIEETSKLVQQGVPTGQALIQAKEQASAILSKENIERKSDPPEVIVERLKARISEGKGLDAAVSKSYESLISQLLEKGYLKCPDCGGSDLVWKCSGKTVTKN